MIDIPSRTCNDCNMTSSDLELFRKAKTSKYGRQNQCHVCASKKATAWQLANPEKGKAWRQANPEKAADYNRGYALSHPEKRSANTKVANALRDGKLIRPEICSECAVRCIPDAHHDQYTYPLLVRWLCKQCHIEHHNPHTTKSVGLALQTKQRMAAAVKKLNVIRKARREGGNHETG